MFLHLLHFVAGACGANATICCTINAKKTPWACAQGVDLDCCRGGLQRLARLFDSRNDDQGHHTVSTCEVTGLLKDAGSRRRGYGFRLVGLCRLSSLHFVQFDIESYSDELPTPARENLYSRALHNDTPKSTVQLPPSLANIIDYRGETKRL